MRRIATFAVVAAAGLAAAVGVTVAATAITDQEIGLDSEPLTAGRELAPAPVKRPARTTTRPTPTTPTPTTTQQTDDDMAEEPGDDSGRGRGRGRGRGGDDDD